MIKLQGWDCDREGTDIEPEDTKDGRYVEITVDGRKVPKVREAIIGLITEMNMNIQIEPPIDADDLSTPPGL